ncbi:MAG: polysaccharide deacetylase family protein [Flavobacteriaceae bacterium]
MNGHFVLSLDFEKHWGVFDKRSVESYKSNLENVDSVVDKLIDLADKYKVKLTFATVGFLFAKNKEELMRFSPQKKPTYINNKRSPYLLINTIGDNEEDDTYHYALSSIEKIKSNSNHEISTHTFCHYYCHEEGQTVQQFEDDIKSSVAIAKSKEINIESIVFPRNMIRETETDKPYLDVCYKYHIKSFRGKEKVFFQNIHTNKFYKNWYLFKILRLTDTYFNISSHNTYKIESLYKNGSPLNLPSSRFLRPYSNTLSFMEPLKINRITKAMKHAAKHNEMYHLWFHPHNFGTNTEKNFNNLEKVFKQYTILNSKYNFKSETMSGLTEKVINNLKTQ